MNKKVNTLLFILGATFFNILVTVLSFLILLVVYTKFIMHLLPEGIQMWSFPIIFIGSLVIAFVTYRYLLRFLLTKIDAEKYFEQIFSSKRKR